MVFFEAKIDKKYQNSVKIN